ncbi:hypothetical protein MGG_17479 [Pyricularia oryzae 70-15]|uniref:Uncharacterized protein n=3 Tax=Pyricularia oryzae TaxID=318829 RepID=G4ND00_PYRO7|nr:uncharacterized protein MGG_17479 [Pyricularia oryzae 70-15]EHA49190.1 hypothetical protein MGG_17479 [Pyricularia oryzae 70-15]ELQ37287.1 hypothetical protein OOU_Y34scaffold00608g54 [Pyricularia oryzae Y34]
MNPLKGPAGHRGKEARLVNQKRKERAKESQKREADKPELKSLKPNRPTSNPDPSTPSIDWRIDYEVLHSRYPPEQSFEPIATHKLKVCRGTAYPPPLKTSNVEEGVIVSSGSRTHQIQLFACAIGT